MQLMQVVFKSIARASSSYIGYPVYNGYQKWPWLHYSRFVTCAEARSQNKLTWLQFLRCFGGGFLRKKRWLLGLRPRPRWGSLQRSPVPLAGREGYPRSVPSPGRRGNHLCWPLHSIFPSYATDRCILT